MMRTRMGGRAGMMRGRLCAGGTVVRRARLRKCGLRSHKGKTKSNNQSVIPFHGGFLYRKRVNGD